MNKKHILLLSLITISATQSVFPESTITNAAPVGWIESGVNKAKTVLSVGASTMWGITTGILLGYAAKAGMKLLQMENTFSPQTGATFTFLALAMKYKESSLRDSLLDYLTKNMRDYEKKKLIKNAASAGSYIGLVLLGLNPGSVFPSLATIAGANAQ